jgi:Transglutaminase-like superfamily
MRKNKIIKFIIAICSILFGCSTVDINYTGPNKKELEKVIIHYKKEGNKEKLKAAYFLINNIDKSTSPNDRVLNAYEPFFDLLDSLNKNGINKRKKDSNQPIDVIKNKWDSLQKYVGNLDNITYTKDIDNITSGYIIKNVDLAYTEWKKNPWDKNVSFAEFCEYILPYKVLDEPFEDWREYFIKRYWWLKDSLKNKYDPVEACKMINNDVTRWFEFNSLFYKYSAPIGFTHLIKGKAGVCPSMVTITAYAARAVGIPVVVDFIPQYGNRSGNHMWLSVLDSNKNFVPFNAAGAEWLPFGSINCINTWRNKMTKIFRTTYAVQKHSLAYLIKDNEKMPAELSDNKYIDVTSEYMPVSNVIVNLENKPPKNCQFSYLCIFDNRDWVPVHWGKIKDNKTLFTDMGRDIVYLPAYYENEKIVPAGKPFILTKDGNKFKIEKLKGIVQSICLTSKYPWYITQRNDTTNKILKADKYELLFWKDDKWECFKITTTAQNDSLIKKLGFDFHIDKFLEGTQNNEFIIFKDVPVGVLFWLHDLTRGRDERIFTIDDSGKQDWW